MAEINSIKRHPNFKDLTGKVFGRLTVIGYAGKGVFGHSKWTCQCSCGAIVTILGTNLIRGRTLSCGCLNRDNAKRMMTEHGMSDTVEYGIWHGILSRCKDPTSRNYGARSIKVCDRWARSFEAFFADMGSRPSDKHSVDRFPNNRGDYEPGNCRWATPGEQALNTRRNVMLMCNGRTRCLIEWARELGITSNAIQWRIRQGWSVERALTVPRRHRHLPDIITSIKTLS